MCPEDTSFGKALPEETQLLKTFLKDDRFVVYDLNQFNSLGLGLTQLHNKRIVFNRKRHGEFQFNGRNYSFYRWREAPKTLSKEFLYVEFLNRFDLLSEDNKKHKKLLKMKINGLKSKKTSKKLLINTEKNQQKRNFN